jgi:tRNA-specific 2-thiouridylase
LIVAFDRPDTAKLYSARCRIGSLSFTNRALDQVAVVAAKPRYRARAAEVRFEPFEKGKAILEFSEPQRALTPGQVCALYDGETLLGGGFFEEIAVR